ncbi:MAG: 3'(2'),5'-bisphosphate nucleotidase [Gammaproteobacteria bacterium]|nr:MAG: 3'(2'),5'-bisphosphate nucleotidase [Gammaproteobacteria bacterium]
MLELFTKQRKQELLEQVISIAIEAGGEIMQVYSGEFEVETKKDSSPITIADKKAHQTIVSGLMQIQSDIPILSEEGAHLPFEIRKNWRTYWLIDPLDGTKEFINRNGEFTVNIALIEDGYPILGVVGYPVANKVYFAATDIGTFEIDLKSNSRQPLSTRSAKKSDIIKVVASKSHMDERLQVALESQTGIETIAVGSSLKLCMLAKGEADFYPRIGPTSEWDIAAAQCVLEVAGGRVLTLDGKRVSYNQKESLVNSDFVALANPDYDWGWIR